MTDKEMIDYLMKRGWKQEGTDAWRWYHPSCRAAHYRLRDAYDLAKGTANKPRR